MSLSDTATPAAGLPAEPPARKPSPSAVTRELVAKAGATRRRNAAKWKIRIGAICTLVVIIPIMLAQLLPLPDANHQDLSARRLAPLMATISP